MTALAQDRKTDKLGTEEDVLPGLLSFPVAASTKIYGGSMVATDASGNAVPASANTALKLWGRCEKQADNSSGAAAAIQVLVRQGVYFFNNGAGADAIAQANVGALCYASDDNTVTLTDGGGQRPAAGVIMNIGANGQIGVYVGQPNLYVINPELGGTPIVFRARAVYATALAAYTYTAGVITANGNGAIANPDGVTVAAGDIVFLPPGVAAAAADQGAYTITSLGSGGTPFVLARVDWLPHASVQKSGFQIKIGGEGTVYKNTTWQAMTAADTFTVGTTDSKFFPTQVSGQSTLVAGTFTISVPVLSTKSNVDLCRVVANTSTATTGGYCATVGGANGITAGNLGTGQVVVQATVAAGTINAADVSTLNWTVTNEA